MTPLAAPPFVQPIAHEAMLALALPDDARRHTAPMDGFIAIHRQSLQAHGSTLPETRVRELLAMDHELNARGIAARLDRKNLSAGARA